MKNIKNAKNLKIVYIDDGSRGWAQQLMRDLAIESELGGQVALYDIDFDAAKQNEIIGNGLKTRKEAVGKWDHTAYKTIGDALTGADFVIISITPGIFDEMEGIKGVTRQDLTYNVIGINHFTFFDKANYKGIDLFPIYDKFIDKYYNEGYNDPDPNEHWRNSNPAFMCKHRVKFDLFRRYGMIAAAGDRHLAEFCNGKEYLKDPETVKSWKFGLTSVDWRKQDLIDRIESGRKYISGEDQLEIKPSGEEGVLQIKVLLGLGNFMTNVNIVNRGQVPQLPLGSVIETNAYFSADEVRPVICDNIPEELVALFSRHIYNQESVLKSALDGDLSHAFRAFCNDPQLTLEAKSAKELFDRMIDNTKAYLKNYKIDQRV